MNEPKVYVLVEDRTRTFEDAVRFGEVEFVTNLDYNVWRPSQNEAILRQVRHKLSQFRKEDFLVMVGSPILIGYAFTCAAAATGGIVKVLQWDRRANRYEPVTLDATFVEERREDA